MASVAIMHLTVAVASLTARGNIQTHTEREREREIECMSGHCRFADTNERMHAMKY